MAVGGGMNNLQIFKSEEFGEIRTATIDGEPWFVGKDVATALGYSNTRDAIKRHIAEEDKGVAKYDTLGGEQELLTVNESGLYALIFGSKLGSAKRFKRWVTSEVLPSIRKNGGYIYNQSNMTPEQILAAGLKVAQEIIDKQNKEMSSLKDRCKFLGSENAEQQKVISELQPKADYLDMILKSKALVLTTQIAKDYGMSARSLNSILHNLGVQYKANNQWVLYAKYQACGYVHSKTYEFTHRDGTEDVKMQTEWTQKGRLFLYELLKKEGYIPIIERGTDE